MKAYHFLKGNMCGGYGSEPAWKIGEERSIKGKLVMCEHGYHASPSWRDALSYAKGNMACIVELSGEIVKDTDKYVARTRKLIDARNAEKVLRTWSCDCAERALKKAKVKDERCWDAIKIARLYNKGKATKEELAAAEFAARSAALAAAEFAAGSAAWSAARSAAWSAAESAAWSAARSAARSAAEFDAESAAWSAVESAAESAAWSAAEFAAGFAEIRWQKRHLNKLMKELFNKTQ